MQFLIHQKAGLHRLVLLFIGSCLCWMLLPTQAGAATGIIADDAQVLDTAAIHQYTDQFSYTVDIFTTGVFQGSNDAFDASVKGLTSDYTTSTDSSCDPKYQVGCELFSTSTLPGTTGIDDPGGSTSFAWRNSDANRSVEIGIDVPTRHLAIYSGTSVTIAQDHYSNAIQAFADTMHQTSNNYTQAMVAALNALQNAGDRFWDGVHAAAPWLVLVVVLVGSIGYALVAQAMGWQGSSSGGYYRRSYNNWHSDGGGGSSSGGNSGGGGGGGASGNF